MNRNTLAALLIATGGSIAGGFALLSSTLAPSGQFIVECAPEDGDCVLVADPAVDQCPVLLEGGGDRPGEMSGLDGVGAQAARDLYAMQEVGVISGFRTLPTAAGCQVAIALSRQQAAEWREILTGQGSAPEIVEDAIATLTPSNPKGVQIQWGGWAAPEQRTEAWDLSAP